MRDVTSTVYTFDELSNEAKERARDWWRTGYDDFDHEYIYDDAATVANIFGFDICQTRKTLMNGSSRYKPTIYWSGFYGQGDGACFEGTYAYKKGAVAAIKKYAPKDDDLHSIAVALQEMQAPFFYKLTGRVKQRGHYNHERSMECSLDYPDNYSRALPEDDFADICADFAHWIYKRLEEEHEYQMSDECIDDALVANEYEFTEEGALA